jgi:hypothetical protein
MSSFGNNFGNNRLPPRAARGYSSSESSSDSNPRVAPHTSLQIEPDTESSLSAPSSRASVGLQHIPTRRSIQDVTARPPRKPPPCTQPQANHSPLLSAEEQAYADIKKIRKQYKFDLRGIPKENKFSYLAEQKKMEAEHIHWAAQALLAQREVFGPDYSPIENMRTEVATGLGCALYKACTGALSAMSRTPWTNAVAISNFLKKRFLFEYDLNAAAGAIGGVPAYFGREIIIKSLDNSAKKFNFKSMEDINLESFFPEPCGISISTKKEIKIYSYTDIKNYKTDVNKNAERKNNTFDRQKNNSGDGFVPAHMQGTISGGLYGLARLASTKEQIENDLTTLATSMLASGLEGFLTHGIFGVAKITAFKGQAHVDNLNGGMHRINIHQSRVPNPELPTPTWADVGRVVLHSGSEGAAFIAHSFDIRRGRHALINQFVDVVRHAFGNAYARLAAKGSGVLVGALSRNNNLNALPNESIHSLGYLSATFTQGLYGDASWQNFMARTPATSYNLTASLERHRDAKENIYEENACKAYDAAHTDLSDFGLPRDLANSLPRKSHEAILKLVGNMIKIFDNEKPNLPNINTAIEYLKEVELISADYHQSYQIVRFVRKHLGSKSSSFLGGDKLMKNLISTQKALTNLKNLQDFRAPMKARLEAELQAKEDAKKSAALAEENSYSTLSGDSPE